MPRGLHPRCLVKVVKVCLLSVAAACATARLSTYVLAAMISGTGPGTNPGWARNYVKRIQARMLLD